MSNTHQDTRNNTRDIWIFTRVLDGEVDRDLPGLIAEARHLISNHDREGLITIAALGSGPILEQKSLNAIGAHRVLYVEHEIFNLYQGERFAETLFRLVKDSNPFCILMVQNMETSDLSARLAALMDTVLVTHTMDFRIDEDGRGLAIRPVSNGYLFEHLSIVMNPCPIICFEPSVLTDPESDTFIEAEVNRISADISSYDVKTKVIEIIEADPGELDIEEADIIIAGGRGVGKGDAFDIIYELAEVINGSVGGTRPVIDWQVLPFERQIGQTGKKVTPRLIFVCGISGANEFTAGMEKSQFVIAINMDPNARIFRFADIGVIGDVHKVVPRLIEGVKSFEKD